MKTKYPFNFGVYQQFIIDCVDALTDSTRAIELDETNIKAYLRKGIALYRLDEKEEASKILECGLQIDGQSSRMFCIERVMLIDRFFSANNDQLKVWQEKCQQDLLGMSAHGL